MSVDTERLGEVLVIRMNRPAKRNAIDRETAVGIHAALVELDEDRGLRVGVLTGTDTVFSAGTDLKEGRDARTEEGGEYGLIRRARRKPLIAAVEGPALGGGFEIVLACDLAVAGETAVFGLPEALRGVIPTSGGLFRASRALPPAIARRLMLTGQPIGAVEAHRLGLVNEVTAPGDAVGVAVGLAEQICRAAPTSVEQILSALRALSDDDDRNGWQVTADAAAAVVASDDFTEGVRAFFERREPRWAGR